MRLDLDTLRPWSVGRVAQALELHPFEVIRILVGEGGLPRDMRVRPADMIRLVEAGGLEAWWGGEAEVLRSPSALVRALARELLERRVVEPTWTRADNLFRGLEPRSQALVRKVVNTWIRAGAMASRMSERGLELTVRGAAVPDLRALADHGTGAYAGLLEDG